MFRWRALAPSTLLSLEVPVLVPWMPMEATESSSQSPSLEEEAV